MVLQMMLNSRADNVDLFLNVFLIKEWCWLPSILNELIMIIDNVAVSKYHILIKKTSKTPKPGKILI